MRFVASLLVLCAIISFVKCDPLWKVFCQETPLYRGRADPIVDPGKAAQHSHKVFGGNAFDFGNPNTSPENYYDQIFASTCTTCSITIDKSVYWVPDLYYRWDNGSISIVPNGGLTIYYPSRSGSGNQTHPDWKPIPRGLRIVAGQSTRRYYNESIVEHKAVSYACLSEPGGPETGEFPTATRFCKNGLRAQVWFPMCWDGKNLDSTNHQSHMSYPIDGRPDGGNCPSTHPVRFPGIFYELLFSVDKFPHGDGVSRFLWSNGDVTGNGLHGDFLNGWDPQIMAAAIADPSCDIDNTCIGNCPEKCAPFTQYVKKNNPDQSCHLLNPMPGTEDLGVGHMLSHLPGCNPITNANPNKVVTPCTGSWPQDSGVDNKIRVAIRGSNNNYATNFNQTNYWATTVSKDKLGYTEMFTLIPQGNGLVAIQSEATTQYCSDTQRGGIPLLFSRGGASDWEFFSVNYTGSDTAPTAAGAAAKIKANSNGQWLVLNADSTIQSSAKTFGDASIFYLVDPNAGVTDTRSNKNDPAFTNPAPPPSNTPPANSESGEPNYYPTTSPTSSSPTTKATSSPSPSTSKPSTASPSTSSPSPSTSKPSTSSPSTASPSTSSPSTPTPSTNSTVAPTQPAGNITKGTTGPEFLATSAASSVYAAFALLAMFVVAMM